MAGPLSVSPQSHEVNEQTLADEGFSGEEIARLRELKGMYPYVEYVDSRSEWHRLRFVKWLYSQGEFKQ